MIFDTVRAVLSDLDDAGAEDFPDWDGRLEREIEGLAVSYTRPRDPARPLIDYSDLSSQAAYVFMYVAGHAEFIYQILELTRLQPDSPLFDDAEIAVTSMGGGPGSELLGLLKYLSAHPDEPVTDIEYTVIDKESDSRGPPLPEFV